MALVWYVGQGEATRTETSRVIFCQCGSLSNSEEEPAELLRSMPWVGLSLRLRRLGQCLAYESGKTGALAPQTGFRRRQGLA